MKKIVIGGSDVVKLSGLNVSFPRGLVVILTEVERAWAEEYGVFEKIAWGVGSKSYLCGAWPQRGGCILPQGHNKGMIDVPSNHDFPEKRILKAVSSEMYYRPVPQPPRAKTLPDQLKRILSRRFWDHDGSLNGSNIQLTENNIAYLNGLEDAGIEGARELINCIEDNKVVEIWISN